MPWYEEIRDQRMITFEEAAEAEQLYKWCHDLAQSKAFDQVVVAAIEARRDEAERCGTDITKTPAERAEHHRAFHLAKDLLALVASRKAEAMGILKEWGQQTGESFDGLPPSTFK